MNKTIRLSRLQITGEIDHHTPKIVLQEISDAHGLIFPSLLDTADNYIIHDEFLQKIKTSSKRQKQISLPPQNDVLGFIAQFVNKHVDWEPEDLIYAFEFLQSYMGDNMPIPEINFAYGLQIPANPHRLNACILYKICKNHSLPLEYEHTIDQMATAIHMVTQPIQDVRSLFMQKVSHIKEVHLPGLYLISCPLMKDFVLEEGPLSVDSGVQTAAEILQDPVNILLRISPQNRSEAIVLAAKNFKIDLSTCRSSVIKEYINLAENFPDWTPHDSHMKKQRARNPMAFSMDVYFNPSLPNNLYDKDDLDSMALTEGFTLNDLRQEGAYSLLQTSILSSTFYHGKYRTITNKRTPIALKRVSKLPFNTVVCFGTLGDSLTAFSYDELAGVIRHNKNFINPLDKEGYPFPSMALRKLKKLTSIVRDGETPQEVISRKQLSQAINLAELFTDELNAKTRDFYLYCHSVDAETKQKVKNILNSFLRLSMFARAWNPETSEKYPVSIALVENENHTKLLVTQGIADFERLCRENKEIGDRILNLPLLRYRNGWQASVKDTDGKTLGDRLKILKRGEDHEEMVSCMRITSNWFAASAYRYMTTIGLDPPFDIERLREIQ